MQALEIKRNVLAARYAMPEYKSELAAGIYLYACIDKPIDVRGGASDVRQVPLGVSVNLAALNKGLRAHEQVEGRLHVRSSLAAEYGLHLANGTGVIDADYQGEIIALVSVAKTKVVRIQPGDRIAQLVLQTVFRPPLKEVEKFSKPSARGAKGLGSTDKPQADLAAA